MSDVLRSILAKFAAQNGHLNGSRFSADLETDLVRLAETVCSLDFAERDELFAQLPIALRTRLHELTVERIKATTEKPAPEIMELALREFNEEEFVAGIREIQSSGGVELHEFLEELDYLIRETQIA